MKKSLIQSINRFCVFFVVLQLFLNINLNAQFTYYVGGNPVSVSITGYTGTGGAVDIPSTIEGYPVKYIADYVFYSNASITSISIPASVTYFGEVQNCVGLTAISVDPANSNYSSKDGVLFNKDATILLQYPSGNIAEAYEIPGTVVKVNRGAFDLTQFLRSAKIPSSVASIGTGAFYMGQKLDTITIPASITCIEPNVFMGCKNLVNVLIPNSVDSLKERAFSDCSGLTTITLSEKLTYIGENAFSSCSVLNNIVVPNSVIYIGAGVFSGCQGLTNITLSDSIDVLNDNLFLGCLNLANITIPQKVTKIGQGVFMNCKALTSVIIPKNVSRFFYSSFLLDENINSFIVDSENMYYSSSDGVIYNKDTTSVLLYPMGKNNPSFTLPSTVTTIDSFAFAYNTYIQSVDINNYGIFNRINYSAFVNCSNLNTATFRCDAPSVFENNVFSGCGNGFKIYYLDGMKDWTTPTWNGYPALPLIEDKINDLNNNDCYIGNIAGGINIYSNERKKCFIYTITGKIYTLIELQNGNNKISLQKGAYILKIKDLAKKIVVY